MITLKGTRGWDFLPESFGKELFLGLEQDLLLLHYCKSTIVHALAFLSLSVSDLFSYSMGEKIF